jgi:hypothetical protein
MPTITTAKTGTMASTTLPLQSGKQFRLRCSRHCQVALTGYCAKPRTDTCMHSLQPPSVHSCMVHVAHRSHAVVTLSVCVRAAA